MATNFDGDSFSRSFRMDAPVMPKTGEFKTWRRDFLSFLSIKGVALIPQLALSSSGIPLNPAAHGSHTLCSFSVAGILNPLHKQSWGFLLDDPTAGHLPGKFCARD
jgi:hypothetical protein